MFIAVIALVLMGGITGVAMETNIPTVSHFGDKYLCADCTPDEESTTMVKK